MHRNSSRIIGIMVLIISITSFIGYKLLVINHKLRIKSSVINYQYFPMILTTPAFKNGEIIPKKFTCEGGDFNPEFNIQNVPQGTRSLALIMEDSDAPGGTFTHWTVWNINTEAIFIKEESKPSGSVEGTNSGGFIGYMGPCPPSGFPHRYFVRVYALDVPELILMSGAKPEEFREALVGHVLAETEIMGIYMRN